MPHKELNLQEFIDLCSVVLWGRAETSVSLLAHFKNTNLAVSAHIPKGVGVYQYLDLECLACLCIHGQMQSQKAIHFELMPLDRSM